MDTNPTDGWVQVGRQFFRKNEIYSFSWSSDIDFDKLYIVGAPFGGPLALSKDVQKTENKPIINILSASGQKISVLRCEIQSRMIGLSWTCMEDLLVVGEKELYLYDMFGNLKNIISIGPEMKDSKIIDFRCFNTINPYTNAYITGVVLLTSKLRFHLIKDVYNSKLQKFPDIPGVNMNSPPPNSWCVISNEKKCFIYIARGTEVFQLSLDREPQQISLGFNKITSAVVSMTPSFNSEYVALATETGTVLLCNNELTRIMHEYASTISSAPKYIAWCANHAIVACWENLVLVTIEGESLPYYEFPPFNFVQEIDGVRIITQSKHEFLQLVPRTVKEIFGFDASGPATTLYEASISFYKDKNQHADDYIRTIKNKNQLEIAINDSIDAASHVYETKYQKDLLRASLFGRYFEEYPNPSAFVKMCQTLRVLNAIRSHTIGMPVTYIQYQALTPTVIVNRLVLRRHFALAMEFCKYLSIPEADGSTKILSYWALYKVKQNDVDDETIAKIISSKLGEASGISYAEIARCAMQAGRHNLAIKLLDYETKASEQVRLYMQMMNPDLALKKAIESGDSDLIYMVLLSYRDKFNNISDFMKDISKNPTAMSLMMQYYRQHDVNKLCDIFDQENMDNDHALTLTKVAYKQDDVNEKLKILDEAQRLFRNKDELSISLIQDEMKLIRKQTEFEKTYRLQLKGKSMYDTFGELMKNHLLKEADEMRKEFKISDTDRSWWFIKIQALSEGLTWEELEKFSKSKKSPVGYEPFLEACMKQNNLTEAKKYYPKVTPENKVRCLILMKNLSDALDLAYETKDEFGINMVLAKCDSSQKTLIEKAKALRNALQTKK